MYKATAVLWNAGLNVLPRYTAVRLALIRYYAAIAFQPFLGKARFPDRCNAICLEGTILTFQRLGI
jgi:hypothetical protein